MSNPLNRPRFNYFLSNTLATHFRHSPDAAAQVAAPTDKKGKDNNIVVAQMRKREPIIVCLVNLSVSAMQ